MKTTILDWFPKVFAPGDMDGATNDRLLGQTELTPLEILIREMAQNSWDARRPNHRVDFNVSLRKTDSKSRNFLSQLLPLAHSNQFSRMIQSPDTSLLEISDRGTYGLDGPTRMHPVGEGESERFIKLIYKVGGSRPQGDTGGTFGFGKTACFLFSELSTVIYWTRCRGADGALEYRLIASAFSDSYAFDGVQYTGRHWWGQENAGSIEPIVGEQARIIGESLFEKRFDGSETGTSILILRPQLNEIFNSDSLSAWKSNEHDCRHLSDHSTIRNIFIKHLWPQMVPLPDSGEPPMSISLRVFGVDAALRLSTGAAIAWSNALTAIRCVERNDDYRKIELPLGQQCEVIPVTRNGKNIGYLGIVKRLLPIEELDLDDPIDPARERSGIDRIATMRGSTELLVAYEDWFHSDPSLTDDWVAVFKSDVSVDKFYAASEPATHDRWIARGNDRETLLLINHTVRRVKRILFSAVGDRTDVANSSAQGESSAIKIARRMASVLPPAILDSRSGPDIGKNRPNTPKRRRSDSRWSIFMEQASYGGITAEGRQQQLIDFSVLGPESTVKLELVVREIGEQGLIHVIPMEELEIHWPENIAVVGKMAAMIPVRTSYRLRIVAHHQRALKIDMKLVDNDEFD